MENVVVELSGYLMIILLTLYTFWGFRVFSYKSKKRQKKLYGRQKVCIILIHLLCYLDLYFTQKNIAVLGLYLAEVIFIMLVYTLYGLVYQKLSKLVLNHMILLFVVSFAMLTRLSFDKAIKQFAFVTIGMGICLIVPFVIEKFRLLEHLGWLYGGIGFVLLASVLVIGTSVYGAKNWVKIGGILIQPSEFVKILFVFFLAALFAKSTEFADVAKVSVLAAGYVLVLVLEKDLGGALIFYITYLFMLYVSTEKLRYFLSGLIAGSVAAVIAYFLFSHVRVRVLAWSDPWSYINGQGYQITQSLFAIGTGGWLGFGLNKGLPTSVPVVSSDFIFSAISEEFGALFAICIILIYMSCFIMFINISMKMKRKFYKLAALGFSVMFMFQTFLSIGGAIKLVPSTGVTLPLLSYGGSSVLSVIVIFSIIQGLYVLNQNEEIEVDRMKRRVKSGDEYEKGKKKNIEKIRKRRRNVEQYEDE